MITFNRARATVALTFALASLFGGVANAATKAGVVHLNPRRVVDSPGFRRVHHDGPLLAFDAEFNGPAGTAPDSSLWTHETGSGWNGGTQLQDYTTSLQNAELDGQGDLVITAQGSTPSDPGGSAQYTSARLISRTAVQYGTVAARIQMSGSPGAWPAFWMLGADYSQVRWPACGEIDTMEALNNYPNLYGSVHGPEQTSPATAYNGGAMTSPSGGLAGGWHIYSVTWTPTSISFALDGKTYATVNKASMPANDVWAFNNPENILLNIAVGGWAGKPAAPAQFHATMKVDWVRATQA